MCGSKQKDIPRSLHFLLQALKEPEGYEDLILVLVLSSKCDGLGLENWSIEELQAVDIRVLTNLGRHLGECKTCRVLLEAFCKPTSYTVHAVNEQ